MLHPCNLEPEGLSLSAWGPGEFVWPSPPPHTAPLLVPNRSNSGGGEGERPRVGKVGKTEPLGSPLVLHPNQGILCLNYFFYALPGLKQNKAKSLSGDKWGVIKVSATLRIQVLQPIVGLVFLAVICFQACWMRITS